VLWRSSNDHRTPICVIVSLAAIVLAVRSLSKAKFVWGLLFLGVMGVFTPFRSIQFSPTLISVLDLVTLALFTVSLMVLRKSRIPAVSTARKQNGALARPFTNQP